MPNQIILPTEGEILFEKNPLLKGYWYWYGLLYLLLSTYVIYHIINNGMEPYIFTCVFGGFVIVMATTYLVLFISGLIRGFANNTYRGIYFKDKIVFHLISKDLDKSFGQSKQQGHIVELFFKDIEYFITQPNHIKVITVDSAPKNTFLTELTLSKKYKKSKTEIVDFLNIGIKNLH